VENPLDDRHIILSARGGIAMTTLIELVCRTHLQPDALGPLITIVDGRWAYCEERAAGEHEWVHIEPTRRARLASAAQDRPHDSSPQRSRVDEEIASLD
jgi:hypothetical protein